MEDKQLVLKSKGETEVIMEGIKEIAEKITKRDVDINKTNVESDERVSMKILDIIKIIAVLGITSGTILLIIGKTDIGFHILSNTIVAIFAFLGGRSLPKQA